MADITYIKPKRISLRNHPVLNEKWLQERIAEDPSILGLGELILRDKEIIQPSGGRLDLLLQDPVENLRYETEIQLGKCDANHIIRCIEYWDIERKRYPQYEHVAVLVAEDITSRFLNVIGLFNGFIPLIALQLSAVQIEDSISLLFTKVLDQMTLGLDDEGEEIAEITDRNYWESRGTKETVTLADELLNIVHGFEPDLELKYNKHYVGLATDERPRNFLTFRPQKEAVRLHIHMARSDEWTEELDRSGLDVIDYNSRQRCYRIRIKPDDISTHNELLLRLFVQANEEYGW